MNERRRGRKLVVQQPDLPYHNHKAQSGPSVRALATNHEAVHRLIEVAAYYRAERRGFEPGGELEDWLNAEAEIFSGAEEGVISLIG